MDKCMMGMEDMSWMMGGITAIGILIIILSVLAIAALIKYLRQK